MFRKIKSYFGNLFGSSKKEYKCIKDEATNRWYCYVKKNGDWERHANIPFEDEENCKHWTENNT